VVRVVIAEDSVLLREGVARVLEDAGFELVAKAGDADDLLRRVRAHKPDGFRPSSREGGERTHGRPRSR
jgi:DNA-binding NarL/FixJ family response regulator